VCSSDLRSGSVRRSVHAARQPTDRRTLPDLAVTRDPGVVDDDRAIADLTIVGDVAHGHDEAARADVGPTVRTRRAMDRDILADHGPGTDPRSEEHTSELQSRVDLVCRLLLEKKKNNNK